jgi:predicted DsbA family dithiol-disulfide isomerase
MRSAVSARMSRATRRESTGGNDINEFLERNVRNSQASPATSPRAVKREALALYRQTLRACRLFEWTDEHGTEWRKRLEQSARSEFEQSRHVHDGEYAAKLVVQGQQALEDVITKLGHKAGYSSHPQPSGNRHPPQ